MKICFIGLGLIGGTLAKAIKQYHPDYYLEAFDPSKANTIKASSQNVISKVLKSVVDFDKDTDIIFLCGPIDNNIQNLRLIKDYIGADTIITDVGSVKGTIIDEAKKLGLGASFIGGHPMTGSEKTGFAAADPAFLENAYYILTKNDETPIYSMELMNELVASIKAIPVLTDDIKHDYATAAISHVPHLVAACLVNMVKHNDYDDGFMRMIAAGGFKDITRIAQSSPVMWENICRNNTVNISSLLDKYIDELQTVNNELKSNNFEYINTLFDESGSYRQSINDTTRGSFNTAPKLYLNIRDEAGAIAHIAGILAANDISIKNIGITHSRERNEGVLYVVFYDDMAYNTARKILTKENEVIIDVI